MLKKKVIGLNIKINALQIYDSMQSKRENYLSYIFSVWDEIYVTVISECVCSSFEARQVFSMIGLFHYRSIKWVLS